MADQLLANFIALRHALGNLLDGFVLTVLIVVAISTGARLRVFRG
jgi:hypothetical protein